MSYYKFTFYLLTISGNIVVADGVEKKDSEMESGIESDQEEDRSSVSDAIQAAAAAAQLASDQTSSIDELIESLMVPPPPSAISPSVDVDELNELVRAPPPSPLTSSIHGSLAAGPPRSSDDTYHDLVIPPPPSSHVNDADVEAFLAKIIACNGIVGPDAAAVNGLSVPGWHQRLKYTGRQMSDAAHLRSTQLTETRSTRTVNAAATNNIGNSHRRRTSTTINGAEGAFRNQKRYFAQSSTSGDVWEATSASQASNNDERFNALYSGVMTNSVEGMYRNWYSSQSGSVSEAPPARQAAVSNYGRASRTPVTQRLQVECLPPDSATAMRSPMLPRIDDVAGSGRTLTPSIGRRRPPPPPPPRTSSVQNSPALSCHSEKLTRRGLPRLTAAGGHRLTPLPTPSPPVRSALIRPGALRSSFAANEPTTNVTVTPPSPDWSFRRSHSLTESATAGTRRTTPTGRRPSLLAAIGSRLRSYWLPSTPRRSRDRPASATGERERSELKVPSRYDVDALLTDDDDNDDTYVSFNVNLTNGQLRTSSTTSSFSSFTGE